MARQRWDLSDRVALVTGGARGIGWQVCQRLAARGATVAVLDIAADEAAARAATLGDRHTGLGCDVTEPGLVTDAVSKIVDRYGQLDVVVANAGVPPPTTTVLAVDPAQFERVLRVNLHGVWHTVRASLPHVVASEGHVLLVASVYAYLNGYLAAPYAMSKAAVEQLGRALRVELACHHTTAGVAYFGFVDTDLGRTVNGTPAAVEAQKAVPGWVTRFISPEYAAERIVTGIERRAGRVAAPGWARAGLVLRGLLDPADQALAGNRHVHRAVHLAEATSGNTGPLLARLPQNYARALRLRDAGEDHRAIAAALGIPEESVGSLLRLAEAKMAHLRHHGHADAPAAQRSR